MTEHRGAKPTSDSVILEEVELELFVDVISSGSHGNQTKAQACPVPHCIGGGLTGLLQQVVCDLAPVVGVDEACVVVWLRPVWWCGGVVEACVVVWWCG